MASLSILLFLVFSLSVTAGTQQKNCSHIDLGSSLFPTFSPSSWLSPSRKFAFGFYAEGDGNGFAVGIWLVGKKNTKVVWTANRNDPPVTSKAVLNLAMDGKLLLRTERGQERIVANASRALGSASFASMLDSGNFVIYDKKNRIIWESFQHPTDTILVGQSLAQGAQLEASSSETSHSTGRFHLVMQTDGNLVLYPLNTGDTPGDAYWNSATFGKFHLYLSFGRLQIIYKNNLPFMELYVDDYDSSLTENSTIYRATLDADGVFRLYSQMYNESGEFNTSILWSAVENSCKVKSFCGLNSYCTFNDYQPYCNCLPGSDFVDPNRGTLGCRRNYSEAGCRGGKANNASFYITTKQLISWGDRPYSTEQLSMEECSRSCLEDCNCGAALFDGAACRKQKLPLRYVVRDSELTGFTAFFKVGIKSVTNNSSDDHIPQKLPLPVMRNKAKAVAQILVLTFSLVAFSCTSLTISAHFIYKFRVLRYKRLLENGNSDLTDELTLSLFSYNELKRATNGFKEELGKGSFGAVYKGTLYKGRKHVAVKRLEKLIEEGEREFQAEMRAIGRTHHRNLVRLLGYCAEESKRLLVYEYMSNGSLADLLFKSTRRPDWNERVRIALDVAKGLLYLHEECEAPIIHCDIKPQNILMDDFWTAKISDFGLAKLLMPDQTRTFTGVRGTRGYLAPEWQKNVPISVKADIYSFGIVLLEIICCRRNIDIHASKTEEIILYSWVYKCFVGKELDKLVLGDEEVDKKNLERMVKVALWCIQDEPALRPSIKCVVLMLEGITEISIPPCPFASSI